MRRGKMILAVANEVEAILPAGQTKMEADVLTEDLMVCVAFLDQRR